jgi:aldose 1-epimerase
MSIPLIRICSSATLALILALSLATQTMATPLTAHVEKTAFGLDGSSLVDLYQLTNTHGMVVKIMTRGATITELQAPDKNGDLDNITLGFDTLKEYTTQQVPYFGAIVGRVGNRIAKGHFTLNGVSYTLATNNGVNHLHGGLIGFDKVNWSATEVPESNGCAVRFSYLSKDGEEGYPGNCRTDVTYVLTNDNTLELTYAVTVDKDCPINVTNHTYFNLAGPEHGSILGHEILINADHYTPVDSTLIPTGELKAVTGTAMDFTSSHAIGERIKAVGGDPIGYDHNYVLNKTSGLSLAARVHESTSGRTMEVYTTEPGVQFYSGNFLDSTLTGKKAVVYKQYGGFCLETQHFPDTVNHSNFPTNVLKAGQTYHSQTIFKFSASKN